MLPCVTTFFDILIILDLLKNAIEIICPLRKDTNPLQDYVL